MRNYLSFFKDLSRLSTVILFAIFINAMGQMFLVFIALYLSSIGFSLQLISLSTALYSIGGLIGSYLGGHFAEQLGIRIILLSLISSIIALLFISVVNSKFIILHIFILGISQNTFKPASIFFLLQGYGQTNRIVLLGLRRIAVNLGVSFGSVIGGILSIKNYVFVFLTESLFSMIAFLVIVCLGLRESSYFTNPDFNINIDSSKKNTTCINLLYILLFINGMVFSQLFITYPLYLKENYALNSQEFANLFAISSTFIIFAEVHLLTFTKGFPHITIAMGSVFLCGGIAIISLCDNHMIIYISVLMWTIGEILTFSHILNLIISYSTVHKGKKIGTYQVINSLGLLLGPAAGSLLYSISNWLWHSCIIASLVSSIICYYIFLIEKRTCCR